MRLRLGVSPSALPGEPEAGGAGVRGGSEELVDGVARRARKEGIVKRFLDCREGRGSLSGVLSKQ